MVPGYDETSPSGILAPSTTYVRMLSFLAMFVDVPTMYSHNLCSKLFPTVRLNASYSNMLDFVRNENRGVGDQGDAAALQNINVDPDVAMNHQVQLQRIVGVGAGDNNAASHPIYHGPWQ